jgi:hypothetical protein
LPRLGGQGLATLTGSKQSLRRWSWQGSIRLRNALMVGRL